MIHKLDHVVSRFDLKQKIAHFIASLYLQFPAAIAVVDHLPCHPAVNADIFSRDKSRLVRTEKKHHVCDIERISYPMNWLLDGIRPLIVLVRGIDLSGGNGIHSNFPRQADGKGVGQGSDSSLGCRVALRLRLAHAVAGRGDIDD